MIRTKLVAEKRTVAKRAPVAGASKPKPGKELISIRLDADVLASYRSLGKGWQKIVNQTLRDALGL